MTIFSTPAACSISKGRPRSPSRSEVWDVAAGRRLVQVRARATEIVGFSQNGSVVAVGIWIWHTSTSVLDVSSAAWRTTIDDHDVAATISADCDTLATEPSAADPTVSVYATRSATKIPTIAAVGLGTELALDPAGRRLVVEASDDAIVWELANPAKPVLRFPAKEAGARFFTRDGRFVVVMSEAALHVHRVSDGAWVEASHFFAAGAKSAPTLVVRMSASMANLSDFW